MRRGRGIFYVILLLAAAAGVAYLVNTTQQANNRAATAEALVATANTESGMSAAQLERLRAQQAADAAKSTATPVMVAVPGPTQLVDLPSASYSYTGTVTIAPRPSDSVAPVTRLRYSVVLPPELKGNVADLRFRLQGGQDLEFKSGQEVMIDIQPGRYVAYIVPKSDSGTAAPIGSTGQFLVEDGQTLAVVFTFIPRQ